MRPLALPRRLADRVRLADPAFGVHTAVGRPTAQSVALYVVLALAGFVVAFLRIPPRSIGLLWAEDAGVFLEAAYRHPLGDAVGTGYAGYAHLAPRMIAAATAAWVPIDDIPLATSVIMAALTSGLGLAVFFLCRAHLSSLVARGLAWLLVVAAPIAGLEIALSTANFQWYLLLAAFWAVFGRRLSVAATATSALLLVVAIGSSAIALLFVPLALFRAIRFRTVHDMVPAGAALIAGIFQLVVVLQSERERGGRSLNPLSLVGNYAVEVVGGAWVGPQLVFWSYVVAPVLVLVATAVLTVVTYVFAWRMRTRRPLGLLAIGLGWIYLVPVMWLTATAGPFLAGWFNPLATGSRYAFLPVALIGLVIVALVDDRLRDGLPARLGSRILLVVLIVAQLAAVVIGYRAADPRFAFLGAIPPWADTLVDARQACLSDPAGSQYLRGGPDSIHEWDTLEVDCDVLLAR